ncbi:MAG: C-3',4' desaturase CrtD [Cyanobacteriota bacterium]
MISDPGPAPHQDRRHTVVVIGAGVAGLTAAALLADAGLDVELLEAHHQSGGCAGTFRRGPYVYDVGATQVAGLEPGGSHHRLCRHLGLPLPEARPLDPGCVVQLDDGSEPIALWRDPERWRQERQRQFPGSERFWTLCAALHQANWAFAGKDPVLPPRTLWDLRQLLGALGPAQLATGVLAKATVTDLLRLCGCAGDQRLRRFLDLQLRLYSQHGADRTAALYGATVLAMAQAPLGLWHLEGSMQRLCDGLELALNRAGGRLRLRHRVTGLTQGEGLWTINGETANGRPFQRQVHSVVSSLPPQTLPALLGDALPGGYRRRLRSLPTPSGALVFYGAIQRGLLPRDVSAHLQLEAGQPGSLFVSVSQEGDGRAPSGEATVIASEFTPSAPWFDLPEDDYQQQKQAVLNAQQTSQEAGLQLPAGAFLHRELATPRGFAGWTGRPFGMVGGLGQTPDQFGPFGLASRTPLPGLWLCGDSLHPGEGTAGVSLSALMAARQLLAALGTPLELRS